MKVEIVIQIFLNSSKYFTDWIQQQYMKQRNNEIFNKSDESGFDSKTPEEIAKDIEVVRF